ncbi:hypothetical protein ONZ45_g16458 [Pleurotus djamor]|nr:hypothetical protein ONZ45_g16458 [Pleurotus djamor]
MNTSPSNLGPPSAPDAHNSIIGQLLPVLLRANKDSTTFITDVIQQLTSICAEHDKFVNACQAKDDARATELSQLAAIVARIQDESVNETLALRERIRQVAASISQLDQDNVRVVQDIEDLRTPSTRTADAGYIQQKAQILHSLVTKTSCAVCRDACNAPFM